MIFWEKSQFADFMSSLFCSYGSDVVSKSYSKIKFMVRYVVPLCAIFVLFFIHALQPTLWSIKHEGVRPWKMGASLLNASAPKTMVSELPIPTFLACRFRPLPQTLRRHLGKQEHTWPMVNVVECPCSSLLQNHGEQLLRIYILVDVTVLEWHSLDSWLFGRWKYIAWHSMGITKVGKSKTETGWLPNVLR